MNNRKTGKKVIGDIRKKSKGFSGFFGRNKRLAEEYRKLEEENESKGIFLNNLSHEARVPINTILGYNEMIIRESRENNTISYAANIQAAGRTLLSIVSDTLDFTNIQEGTFYLEKEPYSLSSVLQNLVSYGNFNAEKKKLDFRVELSDELPQSLVGDAVRLEQICTKLISNAIKYTEGGYVRLKVDWKQDGEKKGQLWVNIKDTGIGIKKDEIKKLGAGHTSKDKRNKKHIPGAGLGLPLVTRLLEMMGSQLDIQSVYGQGTEVSFVIDQDIAGPDNSYNRMQPAEEDFIIPEARILVVDDNIFNLDLMKGMLLRRQAKVDVAMDGEEAITKIRGKNYDMILMDHMMPILDGLEAIRIIRQEKLCKDVPIVVMTANEAAVAKEKYLEAGFNTYLNKPVSAEELFALLKQVLPKYLINPIQNKIPESGQNGAEQVLGLLEQLSFLNTEAGMQCSGNSEELYKEVLLAFLQKEKLEDIEAFYERKDWENYRISMLALRSTSLTIGAERLSEQAKQLELAAKEENHYFIDRHHGLAINEYRRILEGLRTVLVEKTEAEPVEKSEEKNGRILVVDDDYIILNIAKKMLEGRFDVNCVSSGKEALEYIKQMLPELIMLDMHMPEMDGFEVLERLRKDSATKDIPVIFLSMDGDRTVEIDCFKKGAQDFITKPLVADILLQRVSHALELSRLQKNLQSEVEKQTKKAEERRQKVERLSEQIINALTETIDAKDTYTQGHSRRVANYAEMIAIRAGKDKKTQEHIHYMGMLHDIGKIGIPDSIITKNSSLSDKEYFVTRKHPEIGAEILAAISEIPDLAVGARYHHERYDGTGYPDGLAGEAIPEEARIIAVADAYDAMASKRSYRDVLPQKVVYEEIKKGKGTQFDPVFADIMLALMEEDVSYDMREK